MQTSDGPKRPPLEVTKWAFEIHKDADQQLHSRLQTFVGVQAVLGAAFFAAMQLKPHEMPVFGGVILAIGLAVCGLFLWMNRRLTHGIVALKKILKDDDCYKAFYNALDEEAAADQTPDSFYYPYAVGLPACIVFVWLTLALVFIAVQPFARIG